MNKGYIKIPLNLLDQGWKDRETLFFLHLLLKARREDGEWRGQRIPKGSFVTTLPELSESTGLPVITVRRYLQKLVMSRQVSRQVSSQHSIITICNYASYNGYEQVSEQSTEQASEQIGASPSHVRATTIEGSIIYNNINNKSPYSRLFPQLEEQEKEKEREAYKREKVPAKIGGWRFISSMLRAALGNDPEAIAEYKKECIRLELESVASDTPMTPESKEAFLNKWCEHTPGSEKIRAEFEPTFNVAERAKQFMAWWARNRSGMATAEDKRKERLNVNDKWK